MNAEKSTIRDRFLEFLAAELTSAAYPVMLRHGVGGKWLELELDLWKAMTESVRKLKPEVLQGASEAHFPPLVSDFLG